MAHRSVLDEARRPLSVVLVTGGTGTLGRHAVRLLQERGHEVRSLSRRGGTHRGDLSTGAGVPEALAGAELVLHAASDARRRFGRADPALTRNLLAAARGAGVRHLLYVSIVGIDRIPYPYYK